MIFWLDRKHVIIGPLTFKNLNLNSGSILLPLKPHHLSVAFYVLFSSNAWTHIISLYFYMPLPISDFSVLNFYIFFMLIISSLDKKSLSVWVSLVSPQRSEFCPLCASFTSCSFCCKTFLSLCFITCEMQIIMLHI